MMEYGESIRPENRVQRYDAFHPGKIWLDTEGKRIQAHGGSVFYENDTFYWYGENKERTRPGNGILQWGVRCYSSKDLYNWRDEGLIIRPDKQNAGSVLHPSSKAERPHILYCERTKKYVCWLKVMEGARQQAAILISDRLLGPYTLVKDHYSPAGMDMGDFDLAKAPDGKAYCYFERPHTELICAELAEDYLGTAGTYTVHFPRRTPPYTREAPAYLGRKNRHYLLTSGTTGYHPNPSESAVADGFHGPWKTLGNLHPEDLSLTSFGSQISSVFRHPKKKDLYIAVADRWMPGLRELDEEKYDSGQRYRETAFNFVCSFSGDPDMQAKAKWTVPAPDTSEAGYVWLPIIFDGERPVISWQDEWRTEDWE